MPIRFRCPKCQALMQVADEAAGQRTECPGCQSICSIPSSSNIPGSSPAVKQPAPRPASSPSPVKPGNPANPAQGSIIQVRCPSCQQLMRAAAGATVKCPHCSTTVRTPGGAQPAAPASKPSGPAGNPAFTDDSVFPPSSALPNYPSGSSYSPPARGNQPTFQQPASYQPPTSGNFSNPYATTSYSGGGYAASRPADRSWQFTTLGVVFILMSIVMFLSVIFSVVIGVLNIANGAPQQFEGAHIVSIVSSFVITLPIAIVYLLGGISFTRRTGLSAAKTVAVIACIPCFNCLILTPFGIWAAILAFGNHSRSDFDG